MLEAIFPTGINNYLAGGIILGISFMVMYIPTGYISGASAVLSSIFSYFIKIIPSQFRKHRIIYFVGTIFGAFIFMKLFSSPFVTTVPLWRLIVGGYFVGLGATVARGCTSGHGIAGLGSLAKSSIIYVSMFIVIAICTALLVTTLGGAL